MKVKVVIYESKGGGYWAQVPGYPSCASERDTVEEVKENIIDALKGCLEGGIPDESTGEKYEVCEIEV